MVQSSDTDAWEGTSREGMGEVAAVTAVGDGDVQVASLQKDRCDYPQGGLAGPFLSAEGYYRIKLILNCQLGDRHIDILNLPILTSFLYDFSEQ